MLNRFVGKERVTTIHNAFQRYEAWAILIAGFTLVPYKVFTIGAGAFYVNLRVFVIASLLSRGGRFFLVAGAIQLLGPWIKDLLEQYFNLITIGLVCLVLIGFFAFRYHGRKIQESTGS